MSEVRRGYKQTEVGVIPEDWNVTPLGRLVSSVEYGSSAKSSARGNMPVLRMGNLQEGKIDWSDLVFTDVPSEIGKYKLAEGDVLFNRTNTIDLVGKTSLYRGERPAIFAGYLIRIKVDRAVLNSPFLNYILNAEFSRRHSAKVLSVAVGQANINAQKLRTYPVPLPPTRAEQEAIAEALADADALVESLEQLLTKKCQIKQGAMQELLTGKKRLPGFQSKPGQKQSEVGLIPEDWELTTIGAEFSIQLGKMLDAEKNVGMSKPFLGNRAVQWGRIDLSDIGEIRLTASDLQRFRLRDGDLLVCEGGEIGRAAIWRQPVEECYYQKALHRLRPLRGYNVVLMLNHLQRMAATGFLLNFVTQTSIAHLPKDKFETVPVPRPPKRDEQDAIVAILSDMDSDIAALETKLTKAQQLKQGMMQELLIGKTRLV